MQALRGKVAFEKAMRASTAVLALAALASPGCAARLPPSGPSAAEAAPPTRGQPPRAPASAPAAAPAKVASARVIVTGVLQRRSDGIEICHGQGVGPCPGIRVEGEVDDAWISEAGKVAVWRLSGRFDGATLVLDAPAQPTALASQPDYRNSCPELQQPKKGVNPDVALSETVERIVREHADRVAGSWWDRERQTMVISITGDPAELRRRVAERAPGARICVQGGARYSEAELERARARADQILRERGVVWSSSGGDVIGNRITYDADTIDAATLAQIARETGDAVHVVAFIELLDHSIEQLPTPPLQGDVVLATKRSRSGGGMSALGRFSVRYDAAQRCVYFDTPDGRILPVWPFGYWATSSPLEIYDYDGEPVAKEGDAIELGGGMVDIEHGRAENACGAKQAWITSR